MSRNKMFVRFFEQLLNDDDNRYILLASSAVVLLTRIPWIFSGYGLDPDSSRVVVVARYLVDSGNYVPSRFPGYPVHEYLVALVTLLSPSPPFVNGLTAVFSCVAFIFFFLLVRELSIDHHLLLSFAFIMTPVIYVNSVSTIDYVIALSFMLGGVYYGIRKSYIKSGIFTGLAIGTRLTYILMIFPMLIIVYKNANGYKDVLRKYLLFLIACAVIVILCYAYSFYEYGLSFLRFYDISKYPSAMILLKKALFDVWGAIGMASFMYLVLVVVSSKRRIAKLVDVFRQQPLVFLFCVTSIVIYTALFMRLPLESGYLVPIVPFVFILIGILVSEFFDRRHAYIFYMALILSPFLISSLGHNIVLPGSIFTNHLLRNRQILETKRYLDCLEELEHSSVIVGGYKLAFLEAIMYDYDKGLIDKHRYVYYIVNREEVEDYRKQHMEVYYLDGIPEENYAATGIDLNQLGLKPLCVVDSSTG